MSKYLQPILHLPLGNIDAYIARVNQIPMLTLDAERSLARDFREGNKLEAAREMVMAHLRYVVRIARGYRGYGLALGDLIQEGNIGLMKAVKRFDPARGVRLISFAVHWIKAEIHEYVLRNWRIVKMATTKAQRKLFFNFRKNKKRLGWESHAERATIAKDLGVKVADVNEMEQRLNAMDEPFDAPAQGDNFAPVDYLEDKTSDPLDILIKEYQRKELYAALAHLIPRHADIIQQRWLSGQKVTLRELAKKYGVTPERIRQIECASFEKLRNILSESCRS